ncbi:MAG: hypothetical protein LBR83_08365, partial [Clostridiales bacterium]|nr:hypothetical protein [Clostridiales bacterium]
MGYVPLRPVDVAKALKLGTEADGILIAKEFLSGKIAFKKRELRKLAAYKELTLDEIMEADPFLKK